jgi:hypothetical protein
VDFFISSVLQPKGKAIHHANLADLRPSIATEWDWLAAVKIAGLATHSATAVKSSLRKIKLKFNRW